jgi:DNA (cytosine-5)-methyltransferase 3A
MSINVLSLFDGMSCGQLALQSANVEYDNYFSSEIDKYAIKITQKNFPNTIQLGDIRNWREWNLPKIDLIMGGSPCQGFSIAGEGLNFNDPRSSLCF